MDWGAVVLTGGTADRLGGADKAGLAVGGRSLLERALAATAGAGEVVLVGDRGPRRPARCASRARTRPVAVPAAALLAGADALAASDVVVVVAVDMPLVTAATVDRLLAALAPRQPTGRCCDDGRRQPLCAAYRRDALLAAAPARRTGLPVRRLVEGLRLVGVPAVAGEGRDVDEWSDLQRSRTTSCGSGTGWGEFLDREPP